MLMIEPKTNKTFTMSDEEIHIMQERCMHLAMSDVAYTYADYIQMLKEQEKK